MESATDIPAEEIALRYGGPQRWRAGRSDAWTSVEHAALHHYQAAGWDGYAGEGRLILELIKATSFPCPTRHEQYMAVESLYYFSTKEKNELIAEHGRENGLIYWEINRNRLGKVGSLLTNIRNSNARRLRRTIEVMIGGSLPPWPFSTRRSPLHFPLLAPTRPYLLLKAWHLLEAYKVLGPLRLAEIAEVFARDPYTYRAGWPDVTMWRKGTIEFKEIKAPDDKLQESQKKTIGDILIPLGFSVAVVNVVTPKP